MKTYLCALAAAAIPFAVSADGTTLVDTGKLASKEVYGAAQMTPLAVRADGVPAVAFLDVAEGSVVPPHATKADLRILTVVSGTLHWGDGTQVDETKEVIYPQGSVLTVPAGVDHWLAARSGPIRLQMVVVDDETPAPSLVAQIN